MHLLKTHAFALAPVNELPSMFWSETLTKLSEPHTKEAWKEG